MKLRRDGRPLNNQLYIIEESGKGKRGRVSPVVVCPFEILNNYVAAVSLRSLVYLPPASTLPLEWLPNGWPELKVHGAQMVCSVRAARAGGSDLARVGWKT